MKKYVAMLLSVLLLVALLAGCGAESAENKAPEKDTTPENAAVNVNVTAIAGPTGVGLVNLMQKQAEGNAANQYTFNVVGAPDQAVAAIVNGSADIAAVPTNLASTLYKKTGGKVQALAINTLGVLHMLANGETITSVADLKGKTIYTSGQGANPEYILKYVLEKNGIDPEKDVKIEFVADNDALAAAMLNGTAKVAMVPEPKASSVLMQNDGIQRVLNMTEEWEKIGTNDTALVMGCVIARKDFVESNPQAVEKFLEEYKASIEAVQSDVDTAATLCETYKIIPKAALAKLAIPNCGLTYQSGYRMMTLLSGYLHILCGYNPAAIGGQEPADNFYYLGDEVLYYGE